MEWFKDLSSNIFIILRILFLINQTSWIVIVLVFHNNKDVVITSYLFSIVPSMILLCVENISYYYSRHNYNLNTINWTFSRSLFVSCIFSFYVIWFIHNEQVFLIINWIFIFTFILFELIYSYLHSNSYQYEYQTI